MHKARFDAKLCFGEIDLEGSDTTFPDVLRIGKADPARKFVALTAKTPLSGGTKIAVNIQGSADNTTYATKTTQEFTAAEINEGHAVVAIPENWSSEYMGVSITKTGTFTAGVVLAAIDTYPQGA